ncbi:hypothetical protein [Acetivibrio cellulolyticus]|uniref:hypothetical protein n=1 Tax=Acetivibrio cellulolyticus TaxID=35830 RepID=UPI0001E2BE55|nr:hypothetical protein [Acetivibrio cellulolyticus]
MKIIGKLINGTRIISEKVVDNDSSNVPFRDLLEESLITLCRELDISVPLWLKRNTTEFARYRRTSFTKDQFIDSVKFDRFEIKIE